MRKHILVMLFLSMLMVGCAPAKQIEQGTVSEAPEATEVKPTATNLPLVTITMADGTKMRFELYPESAANTVSNFIQLAQSGFYDGLIFHRVIEGFMIQGGDPTGTGTGGPGYSIVGEFSNNGFENTIVHQRGVISMARSRDYDSAGSQFFIMHADAPHLDGDYAAFGKLIEGFDTLDAIATVGVGAQDRPENDQVIQTIEVDLNGYVMTEPKIIQ